MLSYCCIVIQSGFGYSLTHKDMSCDKHLVLQISLKPSAHILHFLVQSEAGQLVKTTISNALVTVIFCLMISGKLVTCLNRPEVTSYYHICEV